MLKKVSKEHVIAIVIILLLFGAIDGRVMRPSVRSNISKEVNTVLVAKNTQALNDCLKNKPGCLGGYIKWPNGTVGRITMSASIYSDFEIGLDSIEIKMSLKEPWFPSTIEYVALPNTAAWDEAVREYGKQFILRR